MFFLIDMKTTIYVEPVHFNQTYFERLKEKLISKIEGKMDSIYGFIIKISKINKISPPRICYVDGSSKYDIDFKVITFHPLRGEIMDGIVSRINSEGIYVNVGPMEVWISKRCMPEELKFEYGTYKSNNVEIEKEDEIRLKLLGIRKENTNFNGIGVINKDFLGPL